MSYKKNIFKEVMARERNIYGSIDFGIPQVVFIDTL